MNSPKTFYPKAPKSFASAASNHITYYDWLAVVGEEEMIADQSGCEYDVWICFLFGLIFFLFGLFPIFVLLLCASGLAMFSMVLGEKGLLEWLVISERYFALFVRVYSWVRICVKGGKFFFLEKLGFHLGGVLFRSGLKHRLAL